MSVSAVSTIGSHAYSNLSPDNKRAIAVGAALEVIAARATGPSGNVNLSYEFEQLSRYADQIQAALANH